MLAQFRTGPIEALLTTITVREHFSLSIDCRDPTYILFQKKKKKKKKEWKNDHLNVKNDRYLPLGGTDFLSSLVTATLLRRNGTVNNLPI